MRTMTSIYQGICSCKIIQYCFISIIWSWKTIMFSLWTKRSEQCIHTSYIYFVLFQLPGVIWYLRIFYLTIAALVCASKRLNNDNSCLHLVNLCDETTRIDWYGELFFSQSLTCGKSVIIVASCCNPGSLRSLFRLVVYNYIVLFIIVINKTATTDIRLNHLNWTALTGLGFFPDIYDHFALSRPPPPPPTSAAYNTSETSLLIGPMYGPVINASLMWTFICTVMA